MRFSVRAILTWFSSSSVAGLLKLWNDVRSSYWFLPSLMTLAGFLLSGLMILVDIRAGANLLSELPLLYLNQPDGARAVLSTIAGSMITVAGVTFSITIASVVYASSQYGPRILTNFMQDRGNQVTLGTFIATFVYCLLVLRTVRSANESVESGPGSDAFVPHLAVVGGIVLALLSVAVLIYFIHHIAAAIALPNVVARIGRRVLDQIERLYPRRLGRPMMNASEPPRLPEGFVQDAYSVKAGSTGYIQTLDADALLHLASEHDLIIRALFRPGNFMSDGQTLLLAWPGERVTDELADALRHTFAWGHQRTSIQDVLFPMDELVEVAARALSPGVNDPFTAMNCLDWLGAAVMELSCRDIPDTRRVDEAGKLRVITHPVDSVDFIDGVFGQLLPYVQTDRNASLHMMKILAQVAQRTDETDEKERIAYYADCLREASAADIFGPRDREEMTRRHAVILEVLSRSGDAVALAERNAWMAGSA